MAEILQGVLKWQKHFAGCKQEIVCSLTQEDMSFAKK